MYAKGLLKLKKGLEDKCRSDTFPPVTKQITNNQNNKKKTLHEALHEKASAFLNPGSLKKGGRKVSIQNYQ